MTGTNSKMPIPKTNLERWEALKRDIGIKSELFIMQRRQEVGSGDFLKRANELYDELAREERPSTADPGFIMVIISKALGREKDCEAYFNAIERPEKDDKDAFLYELSRLIAVGGDFELVKKQFERQIAEEEYITILLACVISWVLGDERMARLIHGFFVDAKSKDNNILVGVIAGLVGDRELALATLAESSGSPMGVPNGTLKDTVSLILLLAVLGGVDLKLFKKGEMDGK